MKLVVKLPEGKPPFIGIEFESPWIGEKEGREVFSNSNQRAFDLVIQPLSSTMSIRLVCEDPVIVKFYSGVEFDVERFKLWIHVSKNQNKINFGHTYSKYSEDKICYIVKDGKKVPMVLKVRRILLEGFDL